MRFAFLVCKGSKIFHPSRRGWNNILCTSRSCCRRLQDNENICMKHVSVVESRQYSTKAKKVLYKKSILLTYFKVIETNIHNPLTCCYYLLKSNFICSSNCDSYSFEFSVKLQFQSHNHQNDLNVFQHKQM